MAELLELLNAIPCASLGHDEWLQVGMALKEEGYSVTDWDRWSRTDPARYHAGECEKRWTSFRGSSSPVTGATITKLAKDYGWTPGWSGDGRLDWDDVIEYDGDNIGSRELPEGECGAELVTYLETLFDPDDHIGYVTSDVFQDQNGKWLPAKGVCHKTAGEIIAALKRSPDDMGNAIEDWKPAAGAWIRINALDGEGVKNENVASFRHALVESDKMPIEEQIAKYSELQLPVAALVHSANKSVHAIVRVDAMDMQEYRSRVNFLYSYLEKHGVEVDTNNKNPSRLSRMPGVTRNGKRQKLLGVNLGRKSWADWIDFVEGESDELPPLESLGDYVDDPPELAEELIEGVLRRGHKMLISGSSKAGKSFLLMELACAIASGKKWLQFQCRQGKVLYVNLEIDRASCANRFIEIAKRYALSADDVRTRVSLWHLRGKTLTLDKLVPRLVRRTQGKNYAAIIIDPIYKVITGDENNASDMAAFCNQFDRIAEETGASVIYCHHHSKGAQGAKRAMDRASGSGVFARDPDAQLDMIELELSDHVRNFIADGGATAWRMECSLREFRNFKPFEFWFEWPVHRLDTEGMLRELPSQGTLEAGRLKNPFSKTREAANDEFRDAFDACNVDGYSSVPVEDIAAYLGISDKTVYARTKKMEDEFRIVRGRVEQV